MTKLTTFRSAPSDSYFEVGANLARSVLRLASLLSSARSTSTTRLWPATRGGEGDNQLGAGVHQLRLDCLTALEHSVTFSIVVAAFREGAEAYEVGAPLVKANEDVSDRAAGVGVCGIHYAPLSRRGRLRLRLGPHLPPGWLLHQSAPSERTNGSNMATAQRRSAKAVAKNQLNMGIGTSVPLEDHHTAVQQLGPEMLAPGKFRPENELLCRMQIGGRSSLKSAKHG